MHLITGTREYVLFAVTGPQADLTAFPVEAAIVPEGTGEPAPGSSAWKPGTWLGGEAALLVDLSTGTPDYAQGDYVLFGRVTAGAERPVMQAGRVSVGPAEV